jgi:glycosyltransferase involved in cell wall biosynthesis
MNSITILGGGELWTVESMKEFINRGYEVSLVCKKKSEIINPAKSTSAEIFELNISGDLNPFTIFRLVNIFRQKKINIVIANTGKDLRLSGLASKFLKNVKVIARQGIDSPLKNNLVYKYVYNHLASAIVANSESTKNTMLKNASWLDHNRIKVIYNGITPQTFDKSKTADLRKVLGFSENDFIVGFIGRLSVQKGLIFALEGFKLLAEKFDNAHLLICGEGELRNDADNFIIKNNLQNKIHLLGFRKDIPDLMRTIDVLLTPSLWEGFGIVLIEAMASGKPVVASMISSIPEIIEDGVSGILIPPENSNSIYDALSRLLSNPGMCRQLGKNGLKIFNEKFTSYKMIKSYEEVFDRLLRSRQ